MINALFEERAVDALKWGPVIKGAATLVELEEQWSYDDLLEYHDAAEAFDLAEIIYQDAAEEDRKLHPPPK